MATYVNDLRLKEIATGDESGTWGTSTNTNLELIAEAFSFGTEAITTNADTHTTTIADGSTDPGRSIYLKYTGTLDSACTITIGPNTVSKLWFIENGTSGSQNIIISQGSGANVTVPAGEVKAIYSDGAGSGAAMVDAFAGLKVSDAAQTNITSLGTLTTLTVDDITIDGSTISDSGDLTLDVGGDIILDAAGSDFQFNIGGTNLLNISNASLSTEILQQQSNTDIKFKGNDGGTTITALTLDMSEAGTAVFNNKVGVSNVSSPNANLHVGSDNATGDTTNPAIQIGGTSTYRMGLYTSAEGAVIENKNGDDGIQFRVKTAGEAMRVDGGTGNVSIGTTTADRELKVQKSSDHSIIAAVSGTSSLAGMVMGDTDDDDIGHVLYNNSNNSMSFRTNTSDRMTIDSSGNVLVGTTTFNNLSTEAGVLASNNVVMARGSLADHQDACAVLQYASDATWLRSYGDTSGSGYMIFRAGGGAGATDVEYMRINSTGEVHITSGGSAISPTIKHGGGTGDVSKLRLINRSGQGADKGGALELGGVTDDGVTRSDVFGSVAGLKTNATSANREGFLQFSTSSGSALSERARFTSGGKLFINTTAAVRGSETVSIDGGSTDCFALKTHAAGAVVRKQSVTNGFIFLFENSSASAVGSITTDASNTTYNTSSDYRLKENIEPMQNGLDRLQQLNPVKFSWKETGIESEGFIAHEVDEVFSDCIYGEKDGDEIQSMDYGRITPLLVKAIQEQQTQIDALQSEIKILKGE